MNRFQFNHLLKNRELYNNCWNLCFFHHVPKLLHYFRSWGLPWLLHVIFFFLFYYLNWIIFLSNFSILYNTYLSVFLNTPVKETFHISDPFYLQLNSFIIILWITFNLISFSVFKIVTSLQEIVYFTSITFSTSP